MALRLTLGRKTRSRSMNYLDYLSREVDADDEEAILALAQPARRPAGRAAEGSVLL
jgi:hypothetical protein